MGIVGNSSVSLATGYSEIAAAVLSPSCEVLQVAPSSRCHRSRQFHRFLPCRLFPLFLAFPAYRPYHLSAGASNGKSSLLGRRT